MYQSENSHEIRKVPVIIGMEAQACAVVNAPFRKGEAIIGLPSPYIYEKLYKENGTHALGVRGPYHLSDRSILPWFEIISHNY